MAGLGAKPTTCEGFKQLGNELFGNKMFDAAAGAYTEALRLVGGSEVAEHTLLLNRAACFVALGGDMASRAVMDASKAVQLTNGTNPKALFRLAQALIASGNHLSALEALNRSQRAMKLESRSDDLKKYATQCLDYLFPRELVVHRHHSVEMAHTSTHGVGMVVSEAVGAAVEEGETLLKENPTVYIADTGGMDYGQRMTEGLLALQKLRSENAPLCERVLLLARREDHGGADKDPAAPADENAALCAVWHCNAMKVTDNDFRIDEGSEMDGVALYLSASRINHSCHPNVVQMFDGRTGQLALRALRRIPPGEELLIAYTGVVASKEDRHHGAKCACRCVVCDGPLKESIGDAMEHLMCVGCGAGPLVLAEDGTWECPNDEECGTYTTAATVADHNQRLEASLAKAYDYCADGNRQGAFEHLYGVCSSLKLYGPYHHARFRVYMETVAASVAGMQQAQLPMVAALAREALVIAERVCPKHWPLVSGLQVHVAMLVVLQQRVAGQKNGGAVSTAQEENFAIGLLTTAFRSHQMTHTDVSLREAVEDKHAGLASFFRRFETEFDLMGVPSEARLARMIAL